MSQKNKDEAEAAEARTQQTRSFIQQVRVTARRKYTPEEKIRIVLEGFRREIAVNELCRREGIKPGAYYAWTKDFIEAGKYCNSGITLLLSNKNSESVNQGPPYRTRTLW